MALYKVWSLNRSVKKAVIASSFDEFVKSAKAKLDIPDEVAVTCFTEDDGTEVQEEVFLYFNRDTVFVIGVKGHGWIPRGQVENTERQNETLDEQLKEELKSFVKHLEARNRSNRTAIRRLRKAAKYLDKVWDNCRIASAVGSSVGMIGGIAIVGGAIAGTGGLSAPAIIGALAGTGTGLGTAAVEAYLNSTQIRKGEKAIQDAKRAAIKVTDQIKGWKQWQPLDFVKRLVDLGLKLYGSNHYAVTVLRSLLEYSGVREDNIIRVCKVAAIAYDFASTNPVVAGMMEACKEVANGKLRGQDKEEKSQDNPGCNIAIVVGLSVAALNGLLLGFTIRDLVTNKGSDAAKALRERADEIEALLAENQCRSTRK